MKGISTVLATILLLMITLALVGMAAGFIFGWWGRAQQVVEQVGSGECREQAVDDEKDLVIIKLRNPSPTSPVTIDIVQTAPSTTDTKINSSLTNWKETEKFTTTIEPGQTFDFQDVCEGSGTDRSCVYKVTPPTGIFSIDVYAICR
ncbi:MAG: archaellin/type IV pilin N-terminal domain-containing protein [Candidatus Aenigmatarchaeota archaeon]